MGRHRRTSSTNRWSRGFTSTALGLVFITDCPPNSTLHHRRSSLPGRRCSCLEQSATTRHFCAFTSRLCISAEKPLLFCFLSRTVLNIQCLWSDFVIIRHTNRLSYYLFISSNGAFWNVRYAGVGGSPRGIAHKAKSDDFWVFFCLAV